MSEWQTPRLAAPWAPSPMMGQQMLPVCPVAAVGPTPTLPVTPRIPLAELDRSSLSTRLFNSPSLSLAAASPSPCRVPLSATCHHPGRQLPERYVDDAESSLGVLDQQPGGEEGPADHGEPAAPHAALAQLHLHRLARWSS